MRSDARYGDRRGECGLGLSRQAISQHLEVLEAAGLVSSRREGRYKFHYLDTTPLKGIVRRWPIDDQERRPKR
jgi:DNA-binding transcriptional ArsR family regulator